MVVDGLPHGGEAHFFDTPEQFARAGESHPDQSCWLPQIVYRLYSRTPPVMLGHPRRDAAAGSNSVACRGMNFGLQAPLVER